jgi:polysaccharide pyruvyl transferase WcaK-like protein
MKGLAGPYDIYVAGSDQIWNPSCISNKSVLDKIYFLEFAKDGPKKISYASSIGGYKFSATEELLVKEYLNKFDSISVREKATQLYLQGLLEKQVQHVLDPTLLLDKNEWLRVSEVSSEFVPNERYILLYTVPKTPLIKKVVEELSKKLQIKVIAIDQGLSAGVKVDKQIRDAGPKEFLRLFACAEFVITDSFHGVCYSLNFERPFVAVSVGVHSSRIESLLNLVGLDDRLINNDSLIKDIKIEYNYLHAYQMLSIERGKSLEYISEALV